MKRLITITAIALCASCTTHRNDNKNTAGVASDTVAGTEKAAVEVITPGCEETGRREVLVSLAEEILAEGNDQIWNLAELDSTDNTEFFTMEGYFTGTDTRDRIALLAGSAGMSAGSADNLLMLISCRDSAKVLWAGQVGDIDPKNVRDLNNDGLLEIVVTTGTMWMGECNETYSIFNFRNGKKNVLYNATSRSVLECGADNPGENFNKGDTLQTDIESRLADSDKDNVYEVVQVRTVKIYNGGKTEEEVARQMKVVKDSTIVKLK